MKNIREILGEKIRYLRKERNLTQEILSEKADIDISYLSEIEGGKVNPSIESIVKIAKGLGINTSVLFTVFDNVKLNQNQLNIITEINNLLMEDNEESLEIIKNFAKYYVDYVKTLKRKT